MAFQTQQRRTDGRKTSLQLNSLFAGPTIQDIERNLPPAYRHRLPPHLASLPVAPDPFTLPSDWTRFVDLNTGRVHYKRDISFAAAAAAAAEARGGNGKSTSPQLDLKQNLKTMSTLIKLHDLSNPAPKDLKSVSFLSSSASPPGSCVSSEAAAAAAEDALVVRPSACSPTDQVASMVLKGCPCCLNYVMLKQEQEDIKCPKCKNPDLSDFLKENSRMINNIVSNKKMIRKE